MNPQHRLFRRDLELERVDDDFIGKLARVEIPAVVEIDMQMLERPEPLL
jgi:ribosomal protein S10